MPQLNEICYNACASSRSMVSNLLNPSNSMGLKLGLFNCSHIHFDNHHRAIVKNIHDHFHPHPPTFDLIMRSMRFPRRSRHQTSNPRGFAERMSLCLGNLTTPYIQWQSTIHFYPSYNGIGLWHLHSLSEKGPSSVNQARKTYGTPPRQIILNECLCNMGIYCIRRTAPYWTSVEPFWNCT